MNSVSKSEFKRISVQRPNDCAGCLRGVPLTEDGRHHEFKGGCGKFRCTKDIMRFCKSCGHSLSHNEHGFDQNDGYMEGDTFVHSGRCTYCKVCTGVRCDSGVSRASV